jgi:biotin carboxylase
MQILLIIGAGVEQGRAYELGQAMSFKVVGTDINPDAPAFELADDTILASTRDPEQTLQAVISYMQENSGDTLAGVITLANDVPLTVATVAEHFGLPNIGIDAARIASDKLLMKSVFSRHKVPTPAFRQVVSIEDVAKAAEDWQWPIVLKPIDGRGARGVLLLDETISLEWAWQESLGFSTVGKLMVEDFVTGPQISSESMMVDGKCHTAAFADRNYRRLDQFRPYIIEDGGTQPAQLTAYQRWSINDLVEKAALAMGITNGIVKGDIVIGPDGPCVIEIAARLSGGYFATDQIPMATGVDLVHLSILLAVGEKVTPEMLKPTVDYGVAIRYFFPPEGKIKAIRGMEKLAEICGVRKSLMYRQIGEDQPLVKAHPDRAGFVIAIGAGREEAQSRVEKAIETIDFDVD